MSRIATIQSEVCAHYGISLRDINGQCRQRHIAHPRQMAMAIARDLDPQPSYPEIGAKFGGRDHTTALHAFKAVQKRQEENPDFHAEFMLVSGRVLEAINPNRVIFRTSRKGATQ